MHSEILEVGQKRKQNFQLFELLQFFLFLPMIDRIEFESNRERPTFSYCSVSLIGLLMDIH